ncbi:MAG: radical SAM protein, partial [Synergistaceae bacterium]|nr:radical SAM protein [Synergistaceae bacterium]
LRKSDEDLKILKAAGYDRLCIGLESGSDKVLSFQQKGVTREDNLNAMRRLDEANIKYSGYIMLGLGGRDLSAEHVEQTSSMLNLARPFELTVVTLVLFKGAKLIEKIKSHEFKRMSPYETLKEGRELLNNLNINVIWNATHKTNLYPVKGKLPEHKDLLLRRIDEVINSLSDKNNLKQYELKRWQNWGVDPGTGNNL